MSDIKFDLGIEEFNINGAYTARFNPADAEFAARMWDTFDKITARAETYQGKAKQTTGAEFLADMRAFNADVSTWLDELLGDGASAKIFADVSPIALSGGVPVCELVLLELLAQMTDSYSKQRRMTDATVQKYIAKYQK